MATTVETQTRVALVSGASSGIGRAVAAALALHGYRVFGTSRDSGRSQPLPGVEMLRLDVRDTDSVAHCVREALSRAGHIDVLVNNAGYALL